MAKGDRATFFTGQTSTTSAPTAGTDGVAVLPGHPNDVTVLVASTAGSGTMTGTVVIAGWDAVAGQWFPHTTLTLDEDYTDQIAHVATVTGLGGFARIHAQITAIAGTGTTISAWMVDPGD